MGYLTTHVLDTAQGKPAAGLPIALYRIEGTQRIHLTEVRTNADGRTDQPILSKDDFKTGLYELVFMCGDYFRKMGIDTPAPLFLDEIPIRFGLSQDDHYHVPLLVSPFGYSTYRGS